MSGPNWDDLRIFLAIAETGSLSGGARALGISQPTAGRRLRALEEALDLTLVERVSNRIELTEAGARIRARAAAMEGAAGGVHDEARMLASRAPAPVRISATGSLALFLTAHLGELFHVTAEAPMSLATAKETASLARRDADIALRMRRLPTEGDIVSRRLGVVGFSIYGARTLSGRDPATWPVIGLPDPERRRSQAAFLEDWADGRPIRARFADLALRYRAVADGHGASVLPCWLGDRDDTLVRVLAPPRELREDAYLLVRGDARRLPTVAAVVRGLTALFKAHAAELAGDAGTRS